MCPFLLRVMKVADADEGGVFTCTSCNRSSLNLFHDSIVKGGTLRVCVMAENGDHIVECPTVRE